MNLSAVSTAAIIKKQQEIALLMMKLSAELERRCKADEDKHFSDIVKELEPPRFERADERWLLKKQAIKILDINIETMTKKNNAVSKFRFMALFSDGLQKGLFGAKYQINVRFFT